MSMAGKRKKPKPRFQYGPLSPATEALLLTELTKADAELCKTAAELHDAETIFKVAQIKRDASLRALCLVAGVDEAEALAMVEAASPGESTSAEVGS